MAVWFYRLGAEERGPINSNDLLALIREGTIQADTMVRKDDSQWARSADINGLWDAANRPNVVFRCPHCGKPINKPPTVCGSCSRKVQHAVGKLDHQKKVVAKPAAKPSTPAQPVSRTTTEGTVRNGTVGPSTTPETVKKKGWFRRR